ncbi:trigger factor [Spirochaetia bacterium 38H-sp]|uniref:Trigger factor n=1 Tax=Rarispira pelagica TaxID=3141764 RepID=A0ABU9UF10_9SPIR
MIKSKDIKKNENSSVKLSITIDKEDAKKAYDSVLAQYAKEAQIPGFRKGKVPAAILEKKFGRGIRYEAGENLIKDALDEAFKEIEEKPLAYSIPTLISDFPEDFTKDITFEVEYDIYPEFSVPDYTDIEVEEPKVSITEEEINAELEKLQKQNAIVVEKEEGSRVEEGDIITVNYQELDENNSPIEGSKREDYVFTVGTKYNLYEFDDELIGLKKGEKKTIEKTFPEDYQVKEFAGTTKKIEVEIKAIKTQNIPNLDDDFAQDVNEKYETLDDLKKDIENRLIKEADSIIRQKKIDQFLAKLSEKTEIPIPKSMIKAELDNSYHQLAHQYQTTEENLDKALEKEGKTREDIYKEWEPSATEALKKRLIINQLIQDKKIEVSDEEMENYYKEIAEGAGVDVEQVKQYYAQMGLTNEQLSYDLKEKKLFDQILEEIKVKKGKKISYVDLTKANE